VTIGTSSAGKLDRQFVAFLEEFKETLPYTKQPNSKRNDTGNG
jgi:hypothetical protein